MSIKNQDLTSIFLGSNFYLFQVVQRGRTIKVMMDNSDIHGLGMSKLAKIKDLADFLKQQGIITDNKGQKVIDLFHAKDTVFEAQCYCKDDRKNGPLLLVVRVSLSKEGFLKDLIEDDTLASLFKPENSAYVIVLRCRPAFWKALKECYAVEQSNRKANG